MFTNKIIQKNSEQPKENIALITLKLYLFKFELKYKITFVTNKCSQYKFKHTNYIAHILLKRELN